MLAVGVVSRLATGNVMWVMVTRDLLTNRSDHRAHVPFEGACPNRGEGSAARTPRCSIGIVGPVAAVVAPEPAVVAPGAVDGVPGSVLAAPGPIWIAPPRSCGPPATRRRTC